MTIGPRCYRHDNPDAMHGFPAPQGYPAHTMSSVGGNCLRCPSRIVQGDLYLCDDGGIVHVTCPAPALAPSPRHRDTADDGAVRPTIHSQGGGTMSALEDVAAERQRQIDKGYTPEHDDEHTLNHIFSYGGLNWHPPHYSPPDAAKARADAVRMAACLVAGIEWLDRKASL